MSIKVFMFLYIYNLFRWMARKDAFFSEEIRKRERKGGGRKNGEGGKERRSLYKKNTMFVISLQRYYCFNISSPNNAAAA